LVGARNEWTARLPSALAVLAVAIAFVTVARASLGPRGSTIAALIWMTNIGMSGDYLLAELLGAKEISVAHLASGIHFSWAWSAGKGPDAPRIFLCDRACRPLACKRLAAASSSCALCRTGHHADRIVRVSDEDLHKY